MTTATDVLWVLQVAMRARMLADSDLVDDLGTEHPDGRTVSGVYDTGAPEGSPFPYVTIGDAIETARNTLGALGAETVQTLHVWTKGDSFKSGLEIAGHLRRLFDHQPLLISGHRVVSVKHEQTTPLRDPNPEVRHIPVRFRITTEQEQDL